MEMTVIIPPELWRFLTVEKGLSDADAGDALSSYLIRIEPQIIDTLRDVNLAGYAKAYRNRALLDEPTENHVNA